MRTSVRHSSLFVIGALLACAVVAVSSAGADSRSNHQAKGKIVFSKWLRGTSDIYTMNADATGVRRLTTGRYYSAFPAWSPDGRKIAFGRFKGNWSRSRGIYVMDSNGRGLRRLAERGSFPTWSPDGTKIAFGNGPRIYVMNADGSDRHLLVQDGGFPAWAPGGTKIAYTKDQVVYLVSADGSDQHLLVRDAYFAAWSTDGRRIAFLRSRGGRGHARRMWVMNTDRSRLRRLGPFSWQDCNLAWSPDGRKIAFSNPDGLFTVNANGSGVVKLRGGPDACGLSWR